MEPVFVFALLHVRHSLNDSTRTQQWYPELSHFCPSTPLLLIGTKTDLRHDPTTLSLLSAQGQKPITSAEGETIAKTEMGEQCKGYLECSAREGRGVKEVFERAVREGMKGKGGGLSAMRGKRGRKCVVL